MHFKGNSGNAQEPLSVNRHLATGVLSGSEVVLWNYGSRHVDLWDGGKDGDAGRSAQAGHPIAGHRR